MSLKPPRSIREQRYKREVDISHDIVMPNILYDGTFYNLSGGGIYFESNQQILPGDKISITVKRLNGTEQSFDIEIQWRKDLQNSSLRFGYGAKPIHPKESIVQIPDQNVNRLAEVENMRRYQRNFYNKPIRLKNHNQSFKGRIRDISRGGAFIETNSIFPIGKKLVLTISGKTARKSVRLTGWVVRKIKEGFGIAFDRRSGAERRYEIDRRKDQDLRGNKKPDKKVLKDQFVPKKSANELAELNMKHQPIF